MLHRSSSCNEVYLPLLHQNLGLVSNHAMIRLSHYLGRVSLPLSHPHCCFATSDACCCLFHTFTAVLMGPILSRHYLEVTRYKAAFTGFDFLRLGGCPVQVPPKDRKVTEQKENTHTRSTAADTESRTQRNYRTRVNEQESESTTITSSPFIRDTQSAHPIPRSTPFQHFNSQPPI